MVRGFAFLPSIDYYWRMAFESSLAEDALNSDTSSAEQVSDPSVSPDEGQQVLRSSLEDIRLDLQELAAHFIEEPENGDWKNDGRNYLIVHEAGKGNDSPLDSARVMVLVINRKIASAESEFPHSEEIAKLKIEFSMLQTRIEMAQKITWGEERLSVFAYGGVYNPTLDRMRP